MIKLGGRGASSSIKKSNSVDNYTKNYSKTIMNQSKESAIVYDDYGNQIMYKDGEKYSVTFIGDELAQLKDKNFTHNHPTKSEYDSLFSKRDLMFAYDNDLKSISTINQKGNIKTLVRNKMLKYDNNHKPGFLAGDYEREKNKITRGIPSSSLEKAARHMNNWLKDNANKYGYEYKELYVR